MINSEEFGSRVQITFLGTSSGATRSRNVSSVALRLPQKSRAVVIDCGEGTASNFTGDLNQITHFHYPYARRPRRLIGLLATCGLAGNPNRIDIWPTQVG